MTVFKEIKMFPVLLIVLLKICAKSLGDILPQSATQLTFSPKAISPKDQVMIIDHPVGINMFTERNNSKIVRLKRASFRCTRVKNCIQCHRSSTTSPVYVPPTRTTPIPDWSSTTRKTPSTTPSRRPRITPRTTPASPIANKPNEIDTSIKNVKGIKLPGGWLAIPDSPKTTTTRKSKTPTRTTPRTHSTATPPPGELISTTQRTNCISTSPNAIKIVETPGTWIISKSKICKSENHISNSKYPNNFYNYEHHIHERNRNNYLQHNHYYNSIQTENLKHLRTAQNSFNFATINNHHIILNANPNPLNMYRAFYQNRKPPALVIRMSSNDCATYSFNQLGNMLNGYFG